MANFNPCCCVEATPFGIIGYDLYNTQVQNFTGVFIDGQDFNSRPVKFGICKGASEFNEFTTPYGDIAMDFVPNPNPKWSSQFNEWRYRCGWPNPYNVNKDPVETLWVTPLAQYINFSNSNSNPDRVSTAFSEYNFPLPQTARFYAKNNTAYGYLVDYAQTAPVQPYLFTSQPGRFVIQTHSEAPGNHYVGLNENGHIACLPFPEDDPNYWASPINHLSPKPVIQNTEGQTLTFKVFAREFAAQIPATSIDYETIVNPPFDTQPLYPLHTTREVALDAVLSLASNLKWDRFIFSKTVGPGAIAGVSLFAPSVKIFQDVADPSPSTPNRRSNSFVTFKNVIARDVFNLSAIEPFLCPCKRTFQDVYLPDAPAGAGQQLLTTPNPTPTNLFPRRFLNSNHPKARLYLWTSPKTWRSYNNKIVDPSPQTDFPQYTDYMPDRPPRYFKMPKKGKIFTGPLYPQNRWEAGGTYFGKYSNRGHTNWTQAAWMTWPGGYTLQPTSLLTDPLNKEYYDAEVAAFKRMISICNNYESKQSTKCINGKWVPTCKDASTLMWSKRYPNKACGVGATADPPPPCGARKLVWSLYHTRNEYGFRTIDAGIEFGPPLAWGDFIFYENLHKDPGATYDYELKTRWVTGDWEKNRCFGFDVPGINLTDGATGISAGMSWEEMQGPEWTPLYPTEKSIKKQCFKKNFGSLQRNYDYFQQKFVDFTKFPPNNPFGVAGVTIDPVVIANTKGWFKSYKGITGGLWLQEGPLVGGWTFNSSFNAYKGECGVIAGNYWEETNDDIFYFLDDKSGDIIPFSYSFGNYIWLISCSVPQFHKKADQPKTQGITTPTPIEGELTGLGWSKNMTYFSPCGQYSFKIDGPTADIGGVCGSTGLEEFSGFTYADLTRNIPKKYKECHGCTWSNPPTWVGVDNANQQFPSRSLTKSYWAIGLPFIGLSNEFPNTPFGSSYEFFPCSNAADSFPQSGYFQLYTAVEEASRLAGDCDWLADISSYINVTFADFRIPYQIGQQTYKITPPSPDPFEYTNYSKDTVSTLIFGPPVQYPDPDNRCD